jgi:crotonobetainyl-CoA:carnitine CoA-transferase CaiB-like acyl-CoA transferase
MTALEGIRVADFTRVLAGPLCTMILGDLGGDVVKVERPGTGDDTRSWGPPFVGDDAAYFLALNRGKRSVVLDLKEEADIDAARRLASRADVVVENFRPGLMDQWGLGYEALSPDSPGLVYCSLSAFAPESGVTRPGYDIVMQAISGLMSITGQPDGEPVKAGVALLDVVAGLYGAIGILAALQERERTGRGQKVDVSLFDAAAAGMVNQAANFLLGGVVPGRLGSAHPNIVPYQLFETSDRPLILAVGNDRQFARTCEVLGRSQLAEDRRFLTNGDRVRNREDLIPELAGEFRRRPREEWLDRLDAAGVPCAPVRTLDEVFASPEGITAVEEVEDPSRGTLRLVRDPVRMSEPRATIRPPPRLGEHTEEVLRELEARIGDVNGTS